MMPIVATRCFGKPLLNPNGREMGFEYKIRLTPDDFAAFENDVAGKTLDAILRAAPGFVATNGKIYSYNTTDDADKKCLESVHVESDGLWLTLYQQEPLRSYLMNNLLSICGRLVIEDG